MSVEKQPRWVNEGPRQWITTTYNDGALVNGSKCPDCGKRVLYNGNYFCEDWGWYWEDTRLDGPCDWALSHPATSKKDRAFCDEQNIAYE